MTKLLSALVGAALFGLAGAAGAAEPVILDTAQLDNVHAGFGDVGNAVTSALAVGQFAFASGGICTGSVPC